MFHCATSCAYCVRDLPDRDPEVASVEEGENRSCHACGPARIDLGMSRADAIDLREWLPDRLRLQGGTSRLRPPNLLFDPSSVLDGTALAQIVHRATEGSS